jgi:hypothetical protein
MRRAFAVAGGGLLGYLVYVLVSWLRYGKTQSAVGLDEPTIARFIPDPEVDEVHETRVDAPAVVTFAAACELDLNASPLVRAIFFLRTIPSRLRGHTEAPDESRGWLAETESLGWGRLSQHSGHEIVIGAITKPWIGEPKFQALSSTRFPAFSEPGFAKIAWTIEAVSLGPDESIFRTRTRVVTTDPESRKRFRRYWSRLSLGILAIRWECLRLVRRSAEERARTQEMSKNSVPGRPSPIGVRA